MADQQNPLQIASTIIEKVLGEGIAINGQVSIQGLTLTSVDKARSLGILPQQSQQGGGQSSQGSQGQQSGSSGQGQSSQQQGGQGQGQSGGSEGQISREEFNTLREEIGYLRRLLESSPQQEGQRGGGRGGQAR